MDVGHDAASLLGVRLRHARLAASLTQEELAERAGVSVRAIGDLERGRTRRPYPRTIRRVIGALRMPDATAAELIDLCLSGRVAASPLPPNETGNPVIPRQLPAGLRHFVGRVREWRKLTELLDETRHAGGTAVVATIGGMAGIGKTTLAVQWAHHVAHRFPDGQLYVNLRGYHPTGMAMTPMQAIRGFLDALDMPADRIPPDLDTQIALYRTVLADRRVLIVLDNARDAEQVRPLLPGEPGCLVVVTSRDQLTSLVAVEDAEPITLDLLTAGEARDLLAGRLGAERVVAEPAAASAIVTRCDRLPLALAVAAAQAATHPHRSLAALAGELADAGTGLDALSAGDLTTDARTVFSWSYRTLVPDAARLFRLLGLHPGPDISLRAAASLAGSPPERIRPVLAELTRASLLVEHAPGRYLLHDLLRVYAGDLVHAQESDAQRRAATHRMLDHYLHTAHTADRLLFPTRDSITVAAPQPGVTPEHHGDQQQALAWFTAEHAVLLTTLDHAAATGFDTHAWHLAWTLWIFLYRQGHWEDWAATGIAALAATRRLADPAAQAHAHRALGRAYIFLGRFDDAHTQTRQALDLFGQAGDHAGQAHAHHSLAYLWERQGQPGQALPHEQQALELYQACGHQTGQARALTTIGWLHAQLGDHELALVACQQGLALHEQLGDREGQAASTDTIGYAHHHLGHHTQAISCYRHAIDLYREINDRYYEATTLTHLGDTHHDTGDTAAAHTTWQQALTILDNLNHPDADTVRAKLGAC